MELSAEMDTVLDHLRTLLTNPSFVPLEEVELRDEEIQRLRENWEKMEVRWKQAVAMMDGWHKRISDGGDSINLDELRKGMSLDSALGRSISIADRSDKLPVYDNDSESEEMQDDDSEDVAEPQAKILKSTLAKPPIRALGERNRNLKSRPSNRKVSFYDGVTSTETAQADEQSDKEETVQAKAHTSETVTQRMLRRPSAHIQHQVSFTLPSYTLFAILSSN
jgi:hypothetical protein